MKAAIALIAALFSLTIMSHENHCPVDSVVLGNSPFLQVRDSKMVQIDTWSKTYKAKTLSRFTRDLYTYEGQFVRSQAELVVVQAYIIKDNQCVPFGQPGIAEAEFVLPISAKTSFCTSFDENCDDERDDGRDAWGGL